MGSGWERAARGGKLVLVDGMFDLEYGPRDVVLIDGNYLHGITSLQGLPGDGQVSKRRGRLQLNRFSLIIFSIWQREKLKRDGRYVNEWREGWRNAVQWKPQLRPEPAVRSRASKFPKRTSL